MRQPRIRETCPWCHQRFSARVIDTGPCRPGRARHLARCQRYQEVQAEDAAQRARREGGDDTAHG